MEIKADSERLVARVQLEFIRDLVAQFVREDAVARPVVDYQSQYIAIVALLRSVGHVFDKVDCASAPRRSWSQQHWAAWKQKPILKNFIEPARNDLLKEFRGGLQLQNVAFGDVAIAADPSMPTGVSRLAAFDASQFRDGLGRAVVPLLRESIEFWDQFLHEAELAFASRVLPGGVL